MKYRVEINRTYSTIMYVDAETESQAINEAHNLSDEQISEAELEQCNIQHTEIIIDHD